ncbi:MAG: MFS transporter [Luteimonas sp.]|nr:MFS transporter [Luteimonas sp.]
MHSYAGSNAAVAPASTPVAALGVMMFLQFFIWGAWYVSVTGWLNAQGLSGLTALVYSVCPIAAILSPLFLGMVADRFFPSQRVLALLHVLGALCMLAVPRMAGTAAPEAGLSHPLVWLLLGHALCYMPTLGLSSAVAFRHITQPEKVFPLIRVCGTVGWIAGNVAVSFLPEGDRSPGQFYLAAGAGLALGFFSLWLPNTPAPLAGRRTSLREILGLDALRLFADRNYLVFIVCAFLICIPLAGYYQQARNFVDFAEVARPTLTMSLGQVSEVLFMLVMPLFFVRLGIKKMLLIGMLAWAVRYGLFAGAADGKVVAMIVAGVLLHGICYDFFFVTGQVYVDRAAPHAIRAQAQGFLVLVTQGLGMLVGAFVFQHLVNAHGGGGADPDWAAIWLWPAVAAVVIAVIFGVLFRSPPR